ncbi:MAG TPA: cytochrome c-type biogenesis CcmF C-terminal domain-containing protein [Gemmatimonadaceae bacterium]|nr:cytochrome c-type biogenesis CcmF C-terminal domain-containing protein [Gemmatimonadaceae bacterium]
MSLLGELSLWVAMALAAWGVVASVSGAELRRPGLVESGARAAYLALAFALLAAVALWAALARSDFSLRYVATYSNLALPTTAKLGAMWAGPAGALLFSALLLAAWGALATMLVRRAWPAAAPAVTGALLAAALPPLTIALVRARPFERTGWGVPDGLGLHPWLQTPAMLLHAPLLYAGLTITTVPLAITVAALTGHRLHDERWRDAVRGWSLAAVILLTLAIALGLRAAYTAPGGTTGWAYAPLDSGAVVPWLTLLALLHVVGVAASRPLLGWSVLLVCATAASALMVALGTQAGRAATGRPAFSYPPAGPLLLGLEALAAGALVVSVAWRFVARRRGAPAAPRTPLARAGAHAAHAGMVVALAGFAGFIFRHTTEVAVAPGAPAEAVDPYGTRWRFESTGVSRISQPGRELSTVGIAATRGEDPLPLVTTERRVYVDARGAPLFGRDFAVPGIAGGAVEDATVLLVDVGEEERARLRVTFTPLVRLIWIGAAAIALGGALALLPRVEEEAT